ncbi:cytosine permease [Paenibacillus beijingensis]|uniref:cytosine permease n=1 Tax=Paenibacillus beijingensis TaxID=1126833 RepID=UPI001930F016|nr:cytosine permease [Paenibacillus beijingensis]
MLLDIILSSGQSWRSVLSYGAQFPPEVLASMHADTNLGKLIFAINVLIGSAGALALVDADIGRYARRSRDIGIAAFLGNVAMDIGMLLIGGIIMFAGMPRLIEYYMNTQGMSMSEAAQAATQSPNSIAAAFIIFGGITGTILMVLAQGKAQVLNTYSGSLALSNLFASFKWYPGRFVFIIMANVIGLIMLYGSLLQLVNAWITFLGVVTTAVAAVMIADYFIVRPVLGHRNMEIFHAEAVNWSGVLSVVIGVFLAHYALKSFIPIEFFTSIVVSLLAYPILRLYILKPNYSSSSIQKDIVS